MESPMNFLRGWKLVGVVATALLGLAVAIAAAHGFDVDGMRLIIRVTARTSLLFFCLAFSAAAIHRLWPGAWSTWQLQNRRYLGVSFAVSHLIHAAAIAGFAQLDPVGFSQEARPAMFILGGIAY